MNKKFVVIDHVKLYRVLEFILCLVIMIGLLCLNNNVHANYKNNTNDNLQVKELEEFLEDYSVIPEELREQIIEDEVEEEEFQVLNIPLSEELQRFCFDTCKKYSMDYTFVLSVMGTESEFKSTSKCKNKAGKGYSLSLMQLNDQYIKWYKKLTNIDDFDIWNEKHNIEAGIAVLKCYRDYWINKGITSEEDLWYYTLNSYNCGIEGYKNYIKKTGEVSRHYDRKVMKNKIKIENGGF